MDQVYTYDLDPVYGSKYISEVVTTSPSGLTRKTALSKSYQDSNADGKPDVITESGLVNDNTTTLEHNVLLSTRSVTSPEGRTAVSSCNPETLLTKKTRIPGLHDLTYGYDTKGRVTSMAMGTRSMGFAYNSQGFIESIVDPENHETTLLYDEAGRVRQTGRPDGTSLWFTYDRNGNMLVLTNPSSIDHAFGFNSVDLVSSYDTPLTGSYSWLYDRDRRLISKTFPSGETIDIS